MLHFSLQFKITFSLTSFNLLVYNDTGIEVGHKFFSRSEMVAVGLHGHWLNGIDYTGNSQGKVLLLHLYIFIKCYFRKI